MTLISLNVIILAQNLLCGGSALGKFEKVLIASDFDGKAKICKVNTDEQGDLAAEYGVRSIPTLIFFKNGEVAGQLVGAQSKQTIADKINSLL